MNFNLEPKSSKELILQDISSKINGIPNYNSLLKGNFLTVEDINETLEFLYESSGAYLLQTFVNAAVATTESDKLIIIITAINKIRQKKEVYFWLNLHKIGALSFLDHDLNEVLNEVFTLVVEKVYPKIIQTKINTEALNTTEAYIQDDQSDDLEKPETHTQDDQSDDLENTDCNTQPDCIENKNLFDDTTPEDWEYLGGEIYPAEIGEPFFLDNIGKALGIKAMYLPKNILSNLATGLNLEKKIYYVSVPFDYVSVPFGAKLLESTKTDTGTIFSFSYFDDDSRIIYERRILKKLAEISIDDAEISTIHSSIIENLPDELKNLNQFDLETILTKIKQFLGTCSYNKQSILHLNERPESLINFTLNEKKGNCLCYAQLITCLLNLNGIEAYIGKNKHSFDKKKGFMNVGHAIVFIVNPDTGRILEFDPTEFLQSTNTNQGGSSNSGTRIRENIISSNRMQSTLSEISTEARDFFGSLNSRFYRPVETLDHEDFFTPQEQEDKTPTTDLITNKSCDPLLETQILTDYPLLSNLRFKDSELIEATIRGTHVTEISASDLPKTLKKLTFDNVPLNYFGSYLLNNLMDLESITIKNCQNLMQVQFINKDIESLTLEDNPRLESLLLSGAYTNKLKCINCPSFGYISLETPANEVVVEGCELINVYEFPLISDFKINDNKFIEATIRGTGKTAIHSSNLPKTLKKLTLDNVPLAIFEAFRFEDLMDLESITIKNCQNLEVVDQEGLGNYELVLENNPELSKIILQKCDVQSLKIKDCIAIKDVRLDHDLSKFEIKGILNPFGFDNEFFKKVKERVHTDETEVDTQDSVILNFGRYFNFILPSGFEISMPTASFNIFKSFFDTELSFGLENILSTELRYKFRLKGFAEKFNIFDLFEFYFLLEDPNDKALMMQEPSFKALFYLLYYSIGSFEKIDNTPILSRSFDPSVLDLPFEQLTQEIIQERLSKSLLDHFHKLKQKRNDFEIVRPTKLEDILELRRFEKTIIGDVRGAFSDTFLTHAFKSIQSKKSRYEIKKNELEFDSLREYRDGDDPRLIDWNSRTRTGKMMIKVYKKVNMKEKTPERSVLIVPFHNVDDIYIGIESFHEQLKLLSIKERVIIKVYHPKLNKIVEFNFFDLTQNPLYTKNLKDLNCIDRATELTENMMDHFLKECLIARTKSEQVPLIEGVDCDETIYLNANPGSMYKEAFKNVKDSFSRRRKNCLVIDIELDDF